MKQYLIKKTKKAFSLIEVIFVLVILGIIASISSQILIQVYENYIIQRAVYNVSTKTELVANQIVNRLSYRIQGTLIAKDHATFLLNQNIANGWAEEDTHWLPLKDIPTGETYTSIEWIGYDNDSFSANQIPNWNGVANYEDNASANGFTSPDSNLNNVATIMNNLSNGKVDLQNTTTLAALIFADNNNFYNGENEYNPLCMGLIPEDAGSSTNCIFRVQQNTIDTFTFPDGLPKIITERYKLAWSAYSLAPELNATTQQYNLFLYSNYQPWNGESNMDAGINKNLLLPNVTVFKFSESGGVINFKICASENIGQDFNVTTCKQKVVIR